MAGMFALMGKRKREREMKRLRIQGGESDETTFSEQVLPGEVEKRNAMLKEAIKRENASKSRSRTRSQSKEKSPKSFGEEDEEGVFKKSLNEPNSLLYMGLVLISIGCVISFVGLGEKGFKTTELKLIGPSLSLLGIFCVFFKVFECYCPFLRNLRLKKAKLADKPLDIVTSSSPNHETPRITLHPGHKPGSSFLQVDDPNISRYIDDTTDDDSDDDFDTGRHAHPPTSYDAAHQIAQLKEQLDREFHGGSSNNLEVPGSFNENGKRTSNPWERELEMKRIRQLAKDRSDKSAGTSRSTRSVHQRTNQEKGVVEETPISGLDGIQSNEFEYKAEVFTKKSNQELILNPKTLLVANNREENNTININTT